MSKAKRAKSGGSAGNQTAKWEQGLLSTPFNEEEKWTGNIAFLVGSQPDDYSHIQVLADAVKSGSRKLFSLVSQEDLYAEVKDLGNPKAKKAKETPQHYEVCEPCKLHLDNNEDIPLPLLARLLKFKFLSIKANDLKRRDNEKKAASDKGGGKKGDKKERGKSAKKGGGKKTPDPPSAKKDSKLRKRGEEDPDSKYIDDEPDDGPNHYILVYGFNHPHLIPQLAEVGINVDSILCVQSQDYSRFLQVATSEEPEVEKDEKQLALEEEEKKKKDQLKKELKKFWRDILPLLQMAPQSSKLHDVARMEYVVRNILIPDDIQDNEKRLEFGTNLFEDVAVMIYDLLDAQRLYHNYLDNLKLIPVPVQGQSSDKSAENKEGTSQVSVTPAQTGPATTVPSGGMVDGETRAPSDVDMRYYTELLDSVPQESVSVPLIMHCMLEQIQATDEDREPPSCQVKPPRADGLDQMLAEHISGIAFKLALTPDEIQNLSTELDVPEQKQSPSKQPLLISYHDDITMRTLHLKPYEGFDAKSAELSMLQRLPLSQLCEIPRPTSRMARERAARLQELIHFSARGGLTHAEIDRAFKQFVFESMELASADSNGYIMTKMFEGIEYSAVPWDDPYPFFKGMIPKHEKHERVVDLLNPYHAVQGLDEHHSESKLETKPVVPVAPSPEPKPPTTPPPGNKDSPKSERKSSRSSADSAKSKGSKKKSKRTKFKTSDDLLEKLEKSESAEGSRPDSAADGETSRPGSAGILKSPKQSRPGSRGSVHFEFENDAQPAPSAGDEVQPDEPEKTMAQTMDEVVDAQKRLLDSWCFVEHFDPQVLLQVLNNASYTLPYMDTYYHKRDHSLLVVLHNPHNAELQSHVDWETSLHSNIGFRNYMEHVQESISEWLKEQEAKYQAEVLAQEVQKIHKDEVDRASKAEAESKKRERSKSPKKSSSRTGKSPSRSSSQERPESANPFIREGSLKAHKEEQDRIKREEEEKQRELAEKRARSAQKRASKEQMAKEEKEKEKKRPGSRGSAKSRASKELQEISAENLNQDQEPAQDEKFWPFTGYDVGNDLIHVSGIVSTLLPSDGGQIRTERIDYVQGTTSVKCNVLKDSHVFTVHVLDPRDEDDELDEDEAETETTEPAGTEEKKEEMVAEEKSSEQEKGETEKSEKEELAEGSSQKEPERPSSAAKEKKSKSVGNFGSFTCQLKDGMCLSLSSYGPNGTPEDMCKREPEPYVSPPIRTPSPMTKESPSKGKKGDKGKEKATPEPPPQVVEEEIGEEDKVEEKAVEVQPFQQMFVTCPDGLHVTYYLESSIGIESEGENSRRVLVRQSYPYKTAGIQASEASRQQAREETSRVINSDGTVMKYLLDGTVQVMFADSTVSVLSYSSQIPGSRTSSPMRAGSAKSQKDIPPRADTPSKKGGQRSRKGSAQTAERQTVENAEEENVKQGQWLTTTPSGERIMTKLDGTQIPVKDVLVCTATDPHTKQCMATRDDHVITVYHPDQTTVVEHRDGTRITTQHKVVQVPSNPELQQDQQNNEETQYESKNIKVVMVECPGYATVKFSTETSECFTEFGCGTIIHTFPDGLYDVYHHDGGQLQVAPDGTVIYRPRPDNNIEYVQNEQNHVYVMRHFAKVICETIDNEGNIFGIKHTGESIVNMADAEDNSSENSSEMGQDKDAKSVREKKIMQYKQHAPRFFIIHANGSGSELLRYQDVAEYLAMSESDPASAFLVDPIIDCPGVMGISVLKPCPQGQSEKWLKSYELSTIMPQGLVSRDLKTLPAKELKKEGPVFGTNVGKGLAIGSVEKPPPRPSMSKCPSALEKRQIVQYRPISQQLRTKLQEGLREYAEFVKARNQEIDDLQVQDPRTEEERVHATDLNMVSQEKQRLDSAKPAALTGDVKTMYERATTPVIPSPPPTPKAKRSKDDWARDQKEKEEELEGRRALREHDVPPYFQSELGKAFLKAPDMEALSRDLANDRGKTGNNGPQNSTTYGTSPGGPPRSAEDSVSSTPMETNNAGGDTPSPHVGHQATTPSNLRPGNPTPAHAAGQGSPAPVRPSNPTPAHADKHIPDRPIAPTPKEGLGQGQGLPSTTPSSHNYPSIQEQPVEEEDPDSGIMPSAESDLVLTRSLQVDVNGEPRKEPVRVPAYLSSGRPGAVPNFKFANVEDPVRRRVFNSSIGGATIKGQTQLMQMRGFELLPDMVDFGVLREGTTYRFVVNLKNMGTDSCRFKVTQPPPSTGIRVIYKPGPVAAGMKAELNIEIYAIAVGVEGQEGVGTIAHDLAIVTETDHLSLPISATVLTAAEYDNRSQSSPPGGKAHGVTMITTKPPGGLGIIRPRKDDVKIPSPPGVSIHMRY